MRPNKRESRFLFKKMKHVAMFKIKVTKTSKPTLAHRQAAKSIEPGRKKGLFDDKEAFLKGAVKELSLLTTAALI